MACERHRHNPAVALEHPEENRQGRLPLESRPRADQQKLCLGSGKRHIDAPPILKDSADMPFGVRSNQRQNDADLVTALVPTGMLTGLAVRLGTAFRAPACEDTALALASKHRQFKEAHLSTVETSMDRADSKSVPSSLSRMSLTCSAAGDVGPNKRGGARPSGFARFRFARVGWPFGRGGATLLLSSPAHCTARSRRAPPGPARQRGTRARTPQRLPLRWDC